MSDDLTKFEVHRMQLAASLKAVADSMRSAADVADAFANRVQNSNFSSGNFTTQDSGDKGIKRKRKPKDPNAPKRPASSYLMFQNEIRKDLKEKNPGTSHHELMSMIGKMWQDMSEADKAIYNSAAANAKEQYSQEKQAYAARSPEEVAAANEATAAAAAAKKAKPRTRAPKTPAIVDEAAVVPVVPAHISPTPESSESSDSDSSGDEEPPKDKKGKPLKDESDEDSSDDEEEETPAPPPAPKRAKTKPAPAPTPAPAPAAVHAPALKKRRGAK